MSKPVTNVEIEDVLSSIRRLVSSSDRSERPEAEAAPETPDKLVLTPSLRVDDVDHAPDVPEEVSEYQEVVGDSSPQDAVEDRVEEEEVAFEPRSDEEAEDEAIVEALAEPDTDDTDSGESSEDMAEAVQDTPAEPLTLDDALDGLLSQNEENLSDFDALDALDDGTQAETAEAAQDAQEDEQENAHFELTPDAMISTASDPDSLEHVVDTDEGDGEPPRASADPQDEDENTLVRRAAEFEEIIARKDDAWDPDDTIEDANTPSSIGPLPWTDEETESDLPQDDADDLPDPDEMDASDADEDAGPDAADAEEAGETKGDLHVVPAAEVPENDLARVMAEVARSEAEAEAEAEAELDTADDTATTEETDTAGLEDVVTGTVEDVATEVTEELVEEAMAEIVDPEPAPFVFRSQSGGRYDPAADDVEPEKDDAQDDAGLTPEEALLDEDALRDMVSEIVRQELQGALGERITRNVRKLVRREIHRALASQDLE